MNALPWEIERLEPELKSWLERSLLVDLWQYRVEAEDTRFDWTHVTQEGHACDCRGRMLDSLSDNAVRDSEGNLVASHNLHYFLTLANGLPKPFFCFYIDDTTGDSNLSLINGLLVLFFVPV